MPVQSNEKKAPIPPGAGLLFLGAFPDLATGDERIDELDDGLLIVGREFLDLPESTPESVGGRVHLLGERNEAEQLIR